MSSRFALTFAAILALSLGCGTSETTPHSSTRTKTKAGPEPQVEPAPHADASVLRVGYMYWAPPRSPFELPPALIVAATVESLDSRPSTKPELRRGPIVDARLEVHEVLFAAPAISPGYDESRATSYAGQNWIESEGFEGLEVGDKLVLFLTAYEGDYALAPVAGANTGIGVKVDSWDDPMLAEARRYGARESLGASSRERPPR